MSALRGPRLIVIPLVAGASSSSWRRTSPSPATCWRSSSPSFVVAFFSLRLVAYRVREREEGEFEFERPGLFWVGTGGTADEIAERYGRPGGNPIVAPRASRGTGLADAVPSYDGHPVGQPDSTEDPHEMGAVLGPPRMPTRRAVQ